MRNQRPTVVIGVVYDAIVCMPEDRFTGLAEMHRLWAEGRAGFNKDLRREGSEARAAKWQKLYYRGLDAHGREGAQDHRTRIRARLRGTLIANSCGGAYWHAYRHSPQL